MAEEIDDASFALIQQMLAADNPYAQDTYYESEHDTDDSEYDGNKGKRKKKGAKAAAKPSKRGNTSKASAAARGDSGADPGQNSGIAAQDNVYSATGRRKRKDAGKERIKSKPWSEEEEKKFLEALELYGREWKKCAEHVGTRDARSFTSHAQKYFIKLCLQGKKLPAKVAESGEGYTLSGKPLDPSSAAAKAYGFKPDSLQSLLDTDAAAGMDTSAVEHPFTVDTPAAENKENISAESKDDKKPKKGAQPKAKRTKTEDKPPAPAPPASDAADPLVPAEPTDYAKNRPRRGADKRRTFFGHTTESLDLLKCSDFVGPPGCGAPLAQPFKVDVTAEALLTMDLHAHLSCCEIIGLLGGHWELATRQLSVKAAFPCRRAQGSDSSTSVELDPQAEVETRALMEQKGLQPVGWYHSHPLFEPRPSAKDAENQRNYQALFCCTESKIEPFVGAIVGPYDLHLPTQASAIRWFMVQTKGGELTTFNAGHNLKPMAAPPTPQQEQELKKTIEMFKDDVGQIEMREMWRGFKTFAGGVPQGGPCTKLAKMRAALQVHLPEGVEQEKECEAFLDRLAAHLQSSWGVDLGY